MNPRDLPILPGPAELASLWPMLIPLALALIIWGFSSYMERKTNRHWREMRDRYSNN